MSGIHDEDRGLGHRGDAGQMQKPLQSAESVLSHVHCHGAKSAPLKCPSPVDMTSTFLSVFHLNFGTNLSHRALLLLRLRLCLFGCCCRSVVCFIPHPFESEFH